MTEDPSDLELAGGPAFPVSIPGCGDNGWHGMTLRDWFAGMALAAIIGSPRMGLTDEQAAEMAYELACAMIKERRL